jgi:translation initiation factor 2B subunit (eIF-2B alpha/beta/delta family)
MTHLSVQISHLVSARPMSVTMGNAIRRLKLEISGSDIDLPEQDVRSALHVLRFSRCPDFAYRQRMRSATK